MQKVGWRDVPNMFRVWSPRPIIGTVKYVQSNSVPSRLLPNSCLPNPGRGPKSNRTSRLFSGSKGKTTKFVRTWGFSKRTRFRNTESLVNPLFWTWTRLKHFRKYCNLTPWRFHPFSKHPRFARAHKLKAYTSRETFEAFSKTFPYSYKIFRANFKEKLKGND